MPIDEVTNAESYALLCGQLRAAAEKRGSQLSKSVMNDLERRLLQRQQSGWFETFLVSIILLNCVERMCWLFQSWDNENFASRVSPTFEHLNWLAVETNDSLILASSGRLTNVRFTTPVKATGSRTFCTCC